MGGCILDCFMWLSLHCFFTFCCSAIPTSCYIFIICLCHFFSSRRMPELWVVITQQQKSVFIGSIYQVLATLHGSIDWMIADPSSHPTTINAFLLPVQSIVHVYRVYSGAHLHDIYWVCFSLQEVFTCASSLNSWRLRAILYILWHYTVIK